MMTNEDRRAHVHDNGSLLLLQEGVNIEIEEVDIYKAENSEWFKRYRHDIPVLHFGGELIMKHYFDQEALEERLEEELDNHQKWPIDQIILVSLLFMPVRDFLEIDLLEMVRC